MSKRKNVWTRSSSQNSAELDVPDTNPVNGAIDPVKRPRSLAWQRPGLAYKSEDRDTASRERGPPTNRPAKFQAAQVSRRAAPSARPPSQTRPGVGPGLRSPVDPNQHQRWKAPPKWSQPQNMARACTAAVLAAAAAEGGPTGGLLPAPVAFKGYSSAPIVNLPHPQLDLMPAHTSFTGHDGSRSSACATQELQLPRLPQSMAAAASASAAASGTVSAGVPSLPAPYSQTVSAGVPSATSISEQKRRNVWVRRQSGKVFTPPSQPHSQPRTAGSIGAVVAEHRAASRPQAAVKRRPKTWVRDSGAIASGALQQSNSITFMRGVRPLPTGRRLSNGAIFSSKSPASRFTSRSLMYQNSPSRIATPFRSSASIIPLSVRSRMWKRPGSSIASPASLAGAQAIVRSAASPRGLADAKSAPQRCTTIQMKRASRRWTLGGASTGSPASRISTGGASKVWIRQLLPNKSATLETPLSTKSASKLRGSSQRYWKFRGLTGATNSPAAAQFRSITRVGSYRSLANNTGAVRRGPSSKKSAGLPVIFCPLFCRNGVCKKRSRGACKYCHDASKVAVCSAWLGGHCSADGCPLQHTHVPALMPVCTYFLQGACSHADCPYLHVNLDPAAPVCDAFLNGYCAAGVSCRAKHLTQRMMRDSGAKRALTIVGREARSKRPRVTKLANIAAVKVPKIAPKADEEPEKLGGGKLPSADEELGTEHSGAQSPWGEFVAFPEESDSE